MTCPMCGNDSKVIESRKVEKVVARKRKCKECGYMFYTEEIEAEEHKALLKWHNNYRQTRSVK